MKSSDELSISGSSTNSSLNSGSSSTISQTYRKLTPNELEQQRLNLDVILSGFPVRPISGIVVQNFLKIHGISFENVTDYYQFENKVNRFIRNNTVTETLYHIVISFKDKSSKSKLFKAHVELGNKIRWNQLSENSLPSNNPIISCRNRFSKLNFTVEQQLRNLKRNGIISEYKFNGVLYCFRQTPVSEWKVVLHLKDLDDFTALLKYVKLR